MTTTTVTPYRAALTPLSDIVATVTDWAAPSPCEGWSGLTLPPAADLAADPVAAWAAHAATVAGLLDDPAIAGIAYDGHFGPTTLGETVERFYVFDMLVHRWDLARAAGSDTSFTDAELDRIDESAQSFGPVLYMEGICRPAVPASSDADRQTRVLATLGRRA